MGDDLIPDDAQTFLLQNIDSIAEWECLLLLRSDQNKTWSAEGAAGNLYITEEATRAVLTRLAKRGMALRDDKSYRYAPSTPELAATIDSVAELYSKYLIPVTQFIHNKPKSRVQEFANSFKLRKD